MGGDSANDEEGSDHNNVYGYHTNHHQRYYELLLCSFCFSFVFPREKMIIICCDEYSELHFKWAIMTIMSMGLS